MSDARKFAGLIRAPATTKKPRDFEARRKEHGGYIRANTAKSKEPAKRDKTVPSVPPFATIFGGVSTHGVTLNSLKPHRVDPPAWDVLTHPSVFLSQPFSQYILPDPALKIRDYFENPDLKFDDQCMLNKSGPHMPNAGDYNSYTIQCRVIIAPADGQQITNALLEDYLSAPTNRGYDIDVPVSGLGVFANNVVTSQSTGSIRRSVVITDSAGNQIVEEVTEPFSLETVMEPGLGGFSATVDLTFYTVNGGDWHAFGVRVA